MLEILPIPAFKDNYIWLIHDGRHAAVVDPGDAQPVIQQLEQTGLTLEAILITHHCYDHIGGVVELSSRYPAAIYAPAKEFYDFPHIPVADGDLIRLNELDLKFTVLEVPGHTLGHVVYLGPQQLFSGDTLFSCGCGRLHEGTAEQMHQSLSRLAQLPADTQVYCAHEYTLNNLAFALELEPDNMALHKRQQEVIELRAAGLPSLPTTIGLELATNPFLRCDSNAIRQSLKLGENTLPVEIFRTLREIKNNY
jgi:hydroxyacylglutathione hydrolase